MASANETKTLDYGPVIADLEAKKRFLEQTIAALKTAAGLPLGGTVDAGSVTPEGATPSFHNGDIPAGAFLGKSIPEAAKLYLGAVKRKQTSKEIAEALTKYGIESTSKNFVGIVHAVLDRARKSGAGIVKLPPAFWGLAEWYPAGLRVTSPATQPKKSKKKAKASTPKAKPQANAAAAAPVVIEKRTPTTGAQERVISLLREKPSAEFSAQQIAVQLDLPRNVVGLLLAKLVSSKKAEKTSSGNFQAVGVKLAASA